LATVGPADLASQAERAVEKADYDLAATLYLQAWQLGKSQTSLVYQAARALHLGGQHDRAEAQYTRFLAHPGRDEVLTARATQHLAEIRSVRAADKALLAEHLGRSARPVEAAATWRAAWQLAPQRIGYLLRAARAQRQCPEFARAIWDYVDFLSKSPVGAERSEAEAELAELRLQLDPLRSYPALPGAPSATVREDLREIRARK